MQSGKTKILQNGFFPFLLLAWGGLKIENPAKVLIWKLETTAKCEHSGKSSTGGLEGAGVRLCCMDKSSLLIEMSVFVLNLLVPHQITSDLHEQ